MYNRSYNRSYNRGRRGMTFKFKTPKRRRFKSKFTPMPMKDSGGGNGSLRVARFVILGLIAAVIVATLVIGMNMFIVNSDRETSSVYEKTQDSQNAELLRVVNKSNPLDKKYVPKLSDKGAYKINVLAEKNLDKMLKAAKKDGISLGVKYAYVSYDEQAKKYKTLYKSYIKKDGLTEVKAQAKTNLTVPQAGRSEYQTGLLVYLDTQEKVKFKKSKANDWLNKNAKDYGFVQRYSADKTNETSMKADYNAYRYVGKENAYAMLRLNMCLNEYSYYINSRK